MLNRDADRTVVLGLALVNHLLSACGKPVLSIESSTIEQLVTAGFTIGAVLGSWWFNNSFTTEAIRADQYLDKLKAQGKQSFT